MLRMAYSHRVVKQQWQPRAPISPDASVWSPATASPVSSILASPGKPVDFLLVPPPKPSPEFLLALFHSLKETVKHSKCSWALWRLTVPGFENHSKDCGGHCSAGAPKHKSNEFQT